MNKFFKYISDKIFSKISKSVQSNEPTSTHRIQSYIIILPILLMVLLFSVIEIWMFAYAIYLGVQYTISTEIIIIFGMLLTHHLAVLFQKDNNLKIDLKKDKTSIETSEN